MRWFWNHLNFSEVRWGDFEITSIFLRWGEVILKSPHFFWGEVRWFFITSNFSGVRWGDFKSPQFLMRWGEVRWLSKKNLERIAALESKNNNKFAYFSILRWGEVRWFWNHLNFFEVRWGDFEITPIFVRWGEVIWNHPGSPHLFPEVRWKFWGDFTSLLAEIKDRFQKNGGKVRFHIFLILFFLRRRSKMRIWQQQSRFSS